MVPRPSAALVFHEPFRRYRQCTTLADMNTLQANTSDGKPCCGGNGPNSIIMGTLELARIPIIGCLVELGRPGPHRPTLPAGSAVMPWLFNVIILRDATLNEWCKNKYLVAAKPKPTHMWMQGTNDVNNYNWPWNYFHDEASCMRLLDPEEYRYWRGLRNTVKAL